MSEDHGHDHVSEEMQEKIGQLQMLEKNMQGFMMQKQMAQSQLAEVESALEEIKDTEETYKIVGNIMVATKKNELQKELKDRKEILKKRLDTVETQEKKIKERAESMQKDLLNSIK